jgi:hypothetical protein
MGLHMKYFVLKPRAKARNDVFARASQVAMQAYADHLEAEGADEDFARELGRWSVQELLRQQRLPEKKE